MNNDFLLFKARLEDVLCTLGCFEILNLGFEIGEHQYDREVWMHN